MPPSVANLLYLFAAVLFILGLKGLTHPRTAPKGNRLGAVGMLIAIVTVLVAETGLNWPLILAGLVVGGAIGALMAQRVQMTAMPQLVALFNGFGGGASLLVAATAITTAAGTGNTQLQVAALASALIGAVTLSGSLVAFAKLQGLIRKTLRFGGQQGVSGRLLAVALACGLARATARRRPLTPCWQLLWPAGWPRSLTPGCRSGSGSWQPLPLFSAYSWWPPSAGPTCRWSSPCLTPIRAWQPAPPASSWVTTSSSSAGLWWAPRA